jgi:type I restriction enzyme S subunit
VLPPLPEQQAIAEVLGSLDDKIASNTKLAATALELAQIEFARVRRSAELAGRAFAEIAEISGGGTPSTKDPSFWDGDIAWATPTDITALPGPFLDSTARAITESGLAACASALHEPGAILMTSRATIGALAIADIRTATNQGFIVVEPDDAIAREWLFHDMRSRTDEFISWANGATFMELSRGNFKKLEVKLPKPAVLAQFESLARPLHDTARSALAENRILAATRDALLPQLMSGRVQVRRGGL